VVLATAAAVIRYLGMDRPTWWNDVKTAISISYWRQEGVRKRV